MISNSDFIFQDDYLSLCHNETEMMIFAVELDIFLISQALIYVLSNIIYQESANVGKKIHTDIYCKISEEQIKGSRPLLSFIDKVLFIILNRCLIFLVFFSVTL